jgi:hypothetical protein
MVYVAWAFGITVVVLVGYALYLRSRLVGLQRQARAAQSARNVSAAAPMATTAQAASSPSGPTTS